MAMRKSIIILISLMISLTVINCSTVDNALKSIEPGSTQEFIVEQAMDTFGYTLGLFAVKDPVFRARVEYYYNEVSKNGLTVTILNEILKQFKNQDIGYQLLAYKMVSLIKVMGGKLDTDGNILSFGKITKHYIEIGKLAYLEAVNNYTVTMEKGKNL